MLNNEALGFLSIKKSYTVVKSNWEIYHRIMYDKYNFYTAEAHHIIFRIFSQRIGLKN